MLIAEIRRKLLDVESLDPEEGEVTQQMMKLLKETKEDLLTADVFGAIKYLPRMPYLESVLRAVADRNPYATGYRNHLPNLVGESNRLTFTFWPSYPNPEGLLGLTTQPDVEIAGDRSLIFVEAKLHSTFGESQVERELAVLLEQAKGREGFLVLVTPGLRPPLFPIGDKRAPFPDYVEGLAQAGKLDAEVAKRLLANRDRVLWLSWNAVINALDDGHERHRQTRGEAAGEVLRAADMLADLHELLAMRNIRPFRGFGRALAKAEGSTFSGRPFQAISVPAERCWPFGAQLSASLQAFEEQLGSDGDERRCGEAILSGLGRGTRSRFTGFRRTCLERHPATFHKRFTLATTRLARSKEKDHDQRSSSHS